MGGTEPKLTFPNNQREVVGLSQYVLITDKGVLHEYDDQNVFADGKGAYYLANDSHSMNAVLKLSHRIH